MTYSYLMMPLKNVVNNFSLVSEDNVDVSRFERDKILTIIEEYYPGIVFNDEGGGNYFANYSCLRGNVELWVYGKNNRISIYDSLDNIICIGYRLNMSVFDVEGNQNLLNP